MKTRDIARQLARRSKVSPAEAADGLDLWLRRVVSDLRRGKEASLPGVGKFKPGPDGRLSFERERKRGRHD